MTTRVMPRGLRYHLEWASTGQRQGNLNIKKGNNCNQLKQYVLNHEFTIIFKHKNAQVIFGGTANYHTTVKLTYKTGLWKVFFKYQSPYTGHFNNSNKIQMFQSQGKGGQTNSHILYEE